MHIGAQLWLFHALQQEGLGLHYHNHDFEFAPVEGMQTGMDLLLEELDSSAVSLCFDAGWAAKAGHDPVAFLRLHAARIRTLYLRDFRGADLVALGGGRSTSPPSSRPCPPCRNLHAALVEAGSGTKTPVEDMAASRHFLQRAVRLVAVSSGKSAVSSGDGAARSSWSGGKTCPIDAVRSSSACRLCGRDKEARTRDSAAGSR